VGGKDVTGQKLESVQKLLQGAVGTKVRIKLMRSGMQFDTTLARAEDATAKKPALKPAAPKPVEPRGKKKLTDREKADKILNGGVKYRGGEHNTSMHRASEAEAARLRADDATCIANAQEVADGLYDENIKHDMETKEAAKAAKQAQGGGWQVIWHAIDCYCAIGAVNPAAVYTYQRHLE